MVVERSVSTVARNKVSTLSICKLLLVRIMKTKQFPGGREQRPHSNMARGLFKHNPSRELPTEIYGWTWGGSYSSFLQDFGGSGLIRCIHTGCAAAVCFSSSLVSGDCGGPSWCYCRKSQCQLLQLPHTRTIVFSR